MNLIQDSINATDYFFVSKVIARSFPHLLESQFIINFSIPWPIKMIYHHDDYKPELYNNNNDNDNKMKYNTNNSYIGKIFEAWFNKIYNIPSVKVKYMMRVLSIIIIIIVILLILLRIKNFKGHYGPTFSDITYSKNKLVLY